MSKKQKYDVIILDQFERECHIFKDIDLSDYYNDITEFVYLMVGSKSQVDYMYAPSGEIDIYNLKPHQFKD